MGVGVWMCEWVGVRVLECVDVLLAFCRVRVSLVVVDAWVGGEASGL